MNVSKIRNSMLLVLTAFIWGVAFVAQSAGGDAAGPYTFNCIRMLLGGMALVPVIIFRDRNHKSVRKPETKQEKKILLLGGISCGIILFISSNLQQVGINMGTPAWKAGFLTACYILLVPILGIFFNRKCGWNVWAGVVIALAGLYLICVNGPLRLEFSDGLVLLCALCFSAHIMVIDYFIPKVDGVRMACLQFFISGILGIPPTLLFDMGHTGDSIALWLGGLSTWDAWIPILYAGLLSCGVGYTLQIVGQEGLNPTVASLLMSLESVFSVLAGCLILHEVLRVREAVGCCLLFTAIILAQLEFGRKRKEKSGEDTCQKVSI